MRVRRNINIWKLLYKGNLSLAFVTCPVAMNIWQVESLCIKILLAECPWLELKPGSLVARPVSQATNKVAIFMSEFQH